MNGNFSKRDNHEDEHLPGIRKNFTREIYGVRRFAYRGRRKYAPILSQSLDGGIVILNDVFGLTISQFERMYKACLDRRNTKEQWITNLRYPDKSSKEYLEYLENCTDCNKGHLLWLENNPKEKYLYEQLVNTVGTEIDIRKRQRLFIILDRIVNTGLDNRTHIASGSLAEGLDLPGSDLDVMYVLDDLQVIRNVKNVVNYPVQSTTYFMETDIAHPGFTRLICIKIANTDISSQPCSCGLMSCRGETFYASGSRFLDNYKKKFGDWPMIVHGPCLSDETQLQDTAFCLRSKYLPHNAIPWISRQRWQWPPNVVIHRIVNYGCLFVPIGPKNVSDSDFLWRMPFSVAEKILVHSFNFTQLLCYGLLKLTLKRVINTNDDVKDLLCSYFLKTALFWVSEEVDIDTFKLSKLYYCFSLCLDKLISWVNTCYCPNYFIPEHNMFLGKINQNNNKIILGVLESIKCIGIGGLTNNVFPLLDVNDQLFSEHIMLDFLHYRLKEMIKFPISKDIFSHYQGLALTKSLIKSESSSFLIDVCKYYYFEISQCIAHLLQTPNAVGKNNNIRKRYHSHLQDGIKTDAVSGWLLYASFYYVTGQYNVTLKLTNHVLSRCSPEMMFRCSEPRCPHRDQYKQNVHSLMTLNEKMKLSIISRVTYFRNSLLIPEELQLEVLEHSEINFPPVVMSHCLRFLCYHHLGDIFNRQQALRDLFLTVKDKCMIPFDLLSNSFTILGVCYEISGDTFTAYQCYDQALHCDGHKSLTAEKRKSKLNGNLKKI